MRKHLNQAKLSRAFGGVFFVGLGGCSMPTEIPALGAPPDQHQTMSCDSLNTERMRLLTERDELNTPLLSSKTQAQKEADISQLNGKLYMVAKAQFDKNCPGVAMGTTRSVLR